MRRGVVVWSNTHTLEKFREGQVSCRLDAEMVDLPLSVTVAIKLGHGG